MQTVLMGMLIWVPSFLAQETKPQTPRLQYEALVKEFQAAEEAWNKRFNVEAGRDSKVDWVARYQEWPGWTFPARFLKLAEENPKDPVATEALLQIVLELGQRVSENAPQFLLSIGQVAPEIEGNDIDGKPLNLSDNRGEAVVLIFWGSWCPPCMAMVPHERSLAERLEGKPFLLLGVNSDEDRESARKAIQKERITWRSWSDGKPPGPIAIQWGVREWPVFYIIDAKE